MGVSNQVPEVSELQPNDIFNVLSGKDLKRITYNNLNNSSLPVNNSKTFGVVGNGSHDDTTAIQSMLDNGGYCILNLEKDFFKITQPLTIYSNTILDGSFYEIRNLTAQGNIFNIADGATNIVIRNLKILGIGSNSIAINCNGNYRIEINNIDMINHQGECVKLDTCVSCLIKNCRAQTSLNNIGFWDINGSSNHYLNCISRENEYGFKFENCNSILIDSCLIESNNRGTAKTGIYATKSSNNLQNININNCYFENNGEYAIQADSNTNVILNNSNIQGNSDYPYDKLLLNGNSNLNNTVGHGVLLSTTTKNIIKLENTSGVYGKIDNIKSELNGVELFNDASDSWFDTGHHLTAFGTTSPTISHNVADGYFIDKSAEIVYPINGNGYDFSRIRFDNTSLTGLTIGEVARCAIVLKANRSGEYVVLRIVSATSDVATYTWITDTNWNIFDFNGVLNGSTASIVMHIGKNLAETLTINVSGIGVVVDGSLSLHQTN